LSPVSTSVVDESTDAMFSTNPSSVAVSTRTTVVLSPASSEPRLQLRTPATGAQPDDADTNDVFKGSVSLTITSSAVLGPALVTTIS